MKKITLSVVAGISLAVIIVGVLKIIKKFKSKRITINIKCFDDLDGNPIGIG